MKILVSAIACNPYGGSESLLGWLASRSLAELGELWLLVSAEERAGVERGRAAGLVPENMHFTFIGEVRPYHKNRLIARIQSWERYMAFSRSILSVARELHERVGFDLSHQITFSTWRVGNPLWRLGIPFIWGPISGTEVFPLKRFAQILSPSAQAFEAARVLGGIYSGLNPEVRATARHAFHIFAAHREAVEHLTKLRGTSDGLSVLSYFTFTPETIAPLTHPRAERPANAPLRILAGGNLEGRKGIAIALHGLALAKKAGTQFFYRVTGRGPELEYLQHLARELAIDDCVILGEGFSRDDYVQELKKTDVYLLPSLREGGGLTMMEAMLAGCVPIVADAGGPGTAVSEECGFRIPIESPAQMARDIAAAVTKLDHNRDLLAQMSEAAPRRIAGHYAHDRFIAAISSVYEKAHQQPSQPELHPPQ